MNPIVEHRAKLNTKMNLDQRMAVGIDLGTTYSVVAQVDEFGQPQIIPNTDNYRTTPSAVYLEGNQVLVGRIARDQAQVAPNNSVQFIKPFIGRRRKRFRVGGEEWSPEELSAMILRKLVTDAETVMGGQRKISHAVITVPAFFTEQQRKSTEDAGRIAGLNVMGIINEPTAAALSYGFEALGTGKTIVVYDLGGGTFDVTIMRVEGDSVTMLATDGDVQLGGKDWDERIIDHIAEIFMERHQVDPREDPGGLSGLYLQAEQTKQRLSKLLVTRVPVVCNGITDTIEITREQFQEMSESLLDQTETTLQLAMEEAGLDFPDLDEVLLVGGSTRMPAVRDMLEKKTGTKPRQILNPDECVAQGAAIHAVIMQLRIMGMDLPVPRPDIQKEQLYRFQRIEERLINAHTLGIVALDKDGSRKVAPIISRGALIPRKEVKNFRTNKDNQKQIRIIVMEGESVHPDACVELGTCYVKDLPENLSEGTPIEVCFECSLDGCLKIMSRLPTIQTTVHTEINRTYGLPEEAILASRNRLNLLTFD
jgi:molecular chaperone DnaK